jgi:hypothetical protein
MNWRERPGHQWADNIKLGLIDTHVDWIELAQERLQRRPSQKWRFAVGKRRGYFYEVIEFIIFKEGNKERILSAPQS